MKEKTIFFILSAFLIVVFSSCIISELSWSKKENSTDSLRQLVGLPSIAVGNLSPAARNPSMEILCTGLYDTPGGYCSYFTDGIPFVDSPINGNITVSGGTK